MEAKNEGASESGGQGYRYSAEFHGRLPIAVADRFDALIERYVGRIEVQKATINRLLEDKHQSELRERSYAEKIHELESELRVLRTRDQGRGSW